MPAPALAQPARPVKLIVPFPAGGTADVLPRILAEKVRNSYPAGIVVENKAGAGGNIGAEFVARSEADGSTFLVSPPGPIAIHHHLYKSLNFDPTSRWCTCRTRARRRRWWTRCRAASTCSSTTSFEVIVQDIITVASDFALPRRAALALAHDDTGFGESQDLTSGERC